MQLNKIDLLSFQRRSYAELEQSHRKFKVREK